MCKVTSNNLLWERLQKTQCNYEVCTYVGKLGSTNTDTDLDTHLNMNMGHNICKKMTQTRDTERI